MRSPKNRGLRASNLLSGVAIGLISALLPPLQGMVSWQALAQQQPPPPLTTDQLDGLRRLLAEQEAIQVSEPGEIETLRQRLLEAEAARAAPGYALNSDVRLGVREIPLSSTSGSPYPATRLTLGERRISSLAFFNEDGAPWPVATISYDSRVLSVNNEGCETATGVVGGTPQSLGSVVLVMPCGFWSTTNIQVFLEGESRPIPIELVSGSRDVEHEIDGAVSFKISSDAPRPYGISRTGTPDTNWIAAPAARIMELDPLERPGDRQVSRIFVGPGMATDLSFVDEWETAWPIEEIAYAPGIIAIQGECDIAASGVRTVRYEEGSEPSSLFLTPCQNAQTTLLIRLRGVAAALSILVVPAQRGAQQPDGTLTVIVKSGRGDARVSPATPTVDPPPTPPRPVLMGSRSVEVNATFERPAAPQRVRLAEGRITSVSFYDNLNRPWQVASTAFDRSAVAVNGDGCLNSGAAANNATNTIFIQPCGERVETNLQVMLESGAQPITLLLTAGGAAAFDGSASDGSVTVRVLSDVQRAQDVAAQEQARQERLVREERERAEEAAARERAELQAAADRERASVAAAEARAREDAAAERARIEAEARRDVTSPSFDNSWMRPQIRQILIDPLSGGNGVAEPIILGKGVTTTLSLLDSAQNPWPIAELAYPPGIFAVNSSCEVAGAGVRTITLPAEEERNSLFLTQCRDSRGTISISLRDRPSPVTLFVVGAEQGRSQPDASLNVIVPGVSRLAPRPDPLMVAVGGAPQGAIGALGPAYSPDPLMDDFLTLTPPQGARSARTDAKGVKGWFYDGALYLVGPFSPINPPYDAMARSTRSDQTVWKYSPPVTRIYAQDSNGRAFILSVE